MTRQLIIALTRAGDWGRKRRIQPRKWVRRVGAAPQTELAPVRRGEETGSRTTHPRDQTWTGLCHLDLTRASDSVDPVTLAEHSSTKTVLGTNRTRCADTLDVALAGDRGLAQFGAGSGGASRANGTVLAESRAGSSGPLRRERARRAWKSSQTEQTP